jgi:hypothetical protein
MGRSKAGGKKQGTGMKQGTGNRDQETGNRKQETGMLCRDLKMRRWRARTSMSCGFPSFPQNAGRIGHGEAFLIPVH